MDSERSVYFFSSMSMFRLSVFWKKWCLPGKTCRRCCWSWTRGEPRAWTTWESRTVSRLNFSSEMLYSSRFYCDIHPVILLQIMFILTQFSLFSFSSRFWKKGGFVPVYLRQTPVSIPHFFSLLFSCFVFCIFILWSVERPDGRALLHYAEGAQCWGVNRAEPVALCFLERWGCIISQNNAAMTNQSLFQRAV